ncbi:uncharacterized protein B0P06_000443 [Clostridium saccharoperbutylacetonicum]|uniref:Arylsulfatase regulator n=3 Tax=Clostridium saccharoperbutylacetonicum TaxID=36745 RepID=M1MGI4_9CLOT|nr:radical SAM protein [Clostridium saccharoperbutylacetonicum]AGF55463.1 arylsulfatase regulator [Clostridium saccharoperbutylacetonicum N1-4(HMT)]NRT63822.1 uncharacterized protein [Clostridium saccharoperbutylacetonicum]NSB27185.1 uncharacterized protein [Clostridium saccharoperbutylacetonicum]NSB40672.1 uncharacterized protein [Clostridium saccharoperbutylacetonicum]
MKKRNELENNLRVHNNEAISTHFTNMMLIITNSCNLRCSYCYEKNHEYDPNKDMTLEIAKKSVDLFFEQIPEKENRTSITFFGGEPLMAFDLMKEIIKYSYNHKTIGGYKGSGYNYVVNTNGTILTDEMFLLFSKLGHKINIRISVDGYKDNHDVTRKTILGNGSWDILKENLMKYKILKEKYGVKVGLINTINKSNCKDIYYNYSSLYELTGMNIGYLFVHEDKLDEKDFEIIKEQVEKLHNYCIKRKMRFSICNVVSNKNEINVQNNAPICSAGVRSFTVNHKGKIYPCHRCYFNNMGSMYTMGDVYSGISRHKIQFMCDINNMNMLPEKCRQCDFIIRRNCHICFTTNKKVYNDPYKIPIEYCMFQKELYYMLREKEAQALKLNRYEEDVFE